MTSARTSFSRLHPLAPSVLFGCEVVFAALSFQPLCAFISFVGAQLCVAQLFDIKHAVKQLAWCTPLVVIMALINPFFSASGSTVLLSFGHSQLYLESLVYGATSGLVLVSTMSWLECLFALLSPLELLQRSSIRFPGLQLVVSLSIQLMPQLLRDLATTRHIQAANTAAHIGVSRSQTAQPQGILQGARKSVIQSVLSIHTVCMSALEKSINTFQSIVSRGWGMTRQRSRWNTEVMDSYDTITSLVFGCLGAVALVSLYTLIQAWQFYPTMPALEVSLWYLGPVLFAVLPVIFVRVDSILWERSS